jgi:hypothetical protein
MRRVLTFVWVAALALGVLCGLIAAVSIFVFDYTTAFWWFVAALLWLAAGMTLQGHLDLQDRRAGRATRR